MAAPPGLQAAANAALNLTLGSRVQVFWPLDVAWYTGTITALDGMRGMVEYDDGDIEELNLSNEKVRLVTAEDTAPEGEAHAAKRARGAGGKDDGAHGHGAMGKPGGEAAAGANGDSVSPNGGERFVVRFVNPHAGARPDGGDADAPAGKPHGHGAGGGHAPGGDKRAQERPAGGRDRAGGGHAPPRSHKAGANQLGLDSVLVPRSDRGVAADGARALVAFGDGGPAFSAQPYSQADAAAVRQWLAARGMVKYAPLFEANEVDMATLPYLTLQDLRDLPIHAVGPRRKLLAALERM